MNFYRQSIILFGVILPIILAVGVVAGGYLMHSKMNNTFTLKETQYRDHLTKSRQVDMIQEDVKADRVHLERWDKQLAKETASEIGTNLKDIIKSLPPKEIQQTAFDPSNNQGGFGSASAQKSSRVTMAFRGTYRTLQKAFLELETRMPQLQLEEMSIGPVKTSGFLLTVQVTYSAWRK